MTDPTSAGTIPQRRRLATWHIVALTLAAVCAAVLIFVGGLVTGVLISGASNGTVTSGGTARTPEGTGPGSTPGATPGASAGPFDSCLVGTWRTTAYEQKASTPQGESVLSGLVRTFTFDTSGKHVVTYDRSVATMRTGENRSELVFDGTVVYQVALDGHTMRFSLTSVTGSVTVRAEGQEKKQDLKPGTGDVTYSCSGDTYTEESSGYREVATRQR